MTHSGDWLPSREQDLADLCEKWNAALKKADNITVYKWDVNEVGEALVRIKAFLEARAAYTESDSSKNRMAKDEAKAACKAALRDFANTSIRFNKAIKDEDKAELGIRPADKNPTPAGEPESYPEAEADTSIIRQVTIHFRDSATKKRAKPRGVHGAEIRWALLERVPASVEELVHSDFDTATPFTLAFGEAERGKRLYFCLRWETNTNIKGPYGEIGQAIIP